MMAGQSKYEAELVRIAKRHFDTARIVQRGKHIAIECFYRGQVRRVFCSATPSCTRTFANIEAQIIRERKVLQ